MTYTDNDEDKSDDMRIELDDREGIWLEWLKTAAQSNQAAAPVTANSGGEFRIGEIVQFKGGIHHYTSMGDARGGNRTAGLAIITNIARTARNPIHVIGGAFRQDVSGSSNVYGWVAESQIEAQGAAETPTQQAASQLQSTKGASLSVMIIQKNWESDGKDRVLSCGEFELDSFDASGGGTQGARVVLKGTSLPNASSVRTQLKTRAWENIRLSAIANEIARINGMKCMFESSFDPLYVRREQVQISDIVFLQGLCYNAGISLKVSGGIIVLFDAAAFERKPAVRKIKRSESDVLSYHFNTSTNDTNYARCRVRYTDPRTGETIEYTYTPRPPQGQTQDPDGITLEINEKVTDRNEARNLAMRRLRQKNREEYSAEFTLVGDTSLAAGVTVELEGWGVFDGKYILATATHRVTNSGYTVIIRLRRVLEGY